MGPALLSGGKHGAGGQAPRKFGVLRSSGQKLMWYSGQIIRPEPTPLLDIATGAGGAWSLRRLSSAYSGAAINVRRSSDSTALDIGFAGSNDLDLKGLQAFVGTGTAFIAKWYDQSGNGNHAVQATAANQPQLITSIATLSGRSAILFGDATIFSLSAPAAATINDVWANGGTMATVFSMLTTPSVAGDRLFTKAGAVGRNQVYYPNIGATTGQFTQPGAGGQGGIWMTPAIALGAHQMDIAYSSASQANRPTIVIDGAVASLAGSSPPNTSITTDSANALAIGNAPPGTWGFPGYIAELIFWQSQPSAAQVRANQRAYWGTP